MEETATSHNDSSRASQYSGAGLGKLTPPKSIGPLLGTYSTERVDEPPQTFFNRAFVAITAGVAVSAALYLVLSIGRDVIRNDLAWAAAISLGIALAGGLIVAIIVFFGRRRRNHLTFVGVDGIARYSWLEGQFENDSVEEIMIYRDVSELRRSITNIYIKGSYGGSNYWFSWIDSSGKERFMVRGAFRSETSVPSEAAMLHFAMAAEAAWNKFQEARMLNQLDQEGTAEFRVFDQDHLRVGQGFLDCTFRGKTTRLIPKDVSCLTLDEGVLHIESPTKKIRQGDRVCRITAGRISNLTLLLQALQDYGGFVIK